MASKNEKRAAQLGISLKKYKKSAEYKRKKSSDKASKKATKKIEKYYDEKKDDVNKKAETETKRLQEDLANVMADSGIAQTRATEDYISNIGNIAEDKGTDIDDLNYYVQTATQRTGEDLESALAQEARRFSLESDRINQGLADSGLTFSERKDEKIAQESSDITTEGIQTKGQRSFQDLARYEATMNRDIEKKFGRMEDEAETTKTRTIEDILDAQQDEQTRIKRGKEDIAFGKATDIRDLGYGEDTAVATTQMLFDRNWNSNENNIALYG